MMSLQEKVVLKTNSPFCLHSAMEDWNLWSVFLYTLVNNNNNPRLYKGFRGFQNLVYTRSLNVTMELIEDALFSMAVQQDKTLIYEHQKDSSQ